MAAWTRSSFCDSASCVEVSRVKSVVLVRDSKLGNLKLQTWPADEWRKLLAAIKATAFHPGIDSDEDFDILLGLPYRDHETLKFSPDEWSAFVRGVHAGEFEIEKLSSPAPAGVAAAGRPAGMGSEGSPSGHATTGAGGPTVPSAPVAAHYQTAGWGGGAGQCGLVCACGTTFDGFDTIAEAAALLDDHIAAHEPVTAVQGADSRPPVVATGAGAEDPCVPAPVAALTNLERAYAIVLAQFRLGGLAGDEIAEGIVGDLFAAGLIVDDPVVDVDELLRRRAAPLVPVDECDGADRPQDVRP